MENAQTQKEDAEDASQKNFMKKNLVNDHFNIVIIT